MTLVDKRDLMIQKRNSKISSLGELTPGGGNSAKWKAAERASIAMDWKLENYNSNN